MYVYTKNFVPPSISCERLSFIFYPKKKHHILVKKIPSFHITQERPCSCSISLKRPSFQNIWIKYHIFMYFFLERSSFIFCPRSKIIFSGKRNIIFPSSTIKIIFQCNFFEKTIFSERLEKENMVFCAVLLYYHI